MNRPTGKCDYLWRSFAKMRYICEVLNANGYAGEFQDYMIGLFDGTTEVEGKGNPKSRHRKSSSRKQKSQRSSKPSTSADGDAGVKKGAKNVGITIQSNNLNCDGLRTGSSDENPTTNIFQSNEQLPTNTDEDASALPKATDSKPNKKLTIIQNVKLQIEAPIHVTVSADSFNENEVINNVMKKMNERMANAVNEYVTKEENGSTVAKDELDALLRYFLIHNRNECAYFPMIKIAAKEVIQYFKQHVQFMNDMFANVITEPNKAEEETLEEINTKLCLEHKEYADTFIYTVGIQAKLKYLYITNGDCKYYNAISCIMHCRKIALMTITKTDHENSPLSLVAVGTPKVVFIFDFVTFKVKHFPLELDAVLKAGTITKLAFDSQHLYKYFQKVYNINILNMFNIKVGDFLVKRQLQRNYPMAKSMLPFLSQIAENLDGVILNLTDYEHIKWNKRPLNEKSIDTVAKLCSYLFKATCGIHLAKLFLCHALSMQLIVGDDLCF